MGETAWTVEAALTGRTLVPVYRVMLALEPDGGAGWAVDHLEFHLAAARSEMVVVPTPADAKSAGYLRWAGSSVRGASETTARAVLVCPDGTFRGQTRARLAYGTTDALGLTTGWVSLGGRTGSALALDIAGLAPGTGYRYRFEVGDAAGVVAASPLMGFRTARAADAPDASYSFWVGSCSYDVGAGHPHDALGPMLDAVEAEPTPVLFNRHVGDQGYDGSGMTRSDGKPGPTTVAHFDQQLRQWATDPHTWRQMTMAAYEGSPDDHQVVNGVDTQWSPGGTFAGQRINEFDRRQNDYDENPTMGEIWTNGLALFDAWFPQPHYEAGPSEIGEQKRYGSTRSGALYRISLDSRFAARDDSQGVMMGADQMAWLSAEVAAFEASGARLLVVDSQGVFGPIGSNASSGEPDGWSAVAPAEYEAFVSHVRDTVSRSKTVVLVGGDKHLGYTVSPIFWSTEGEVPVGDRAPFLADVTSSGISASYYHNTDDTGRVRYFKGSRESDMIAYYDPALASYAGSGDNVRTSGVLFTVDEAAGTVRLRCWGNRDAALLLDETLAMYEEDEVEPPPPDTTPPEVVVFEVTSATPGRLRVALRTSEPLGTLAVTLDGPDSATLSRASFVATAQGSGVTDYVADLARSAGDYTVTLTGAADAAGNPYTSDVATTATVTVAEPPTPTTEPPSQGSGPKRPERTLYGTDLVDEVTAHEVMRFVEGFQSAGPVVRGFLGAGLAFFREDGRWKGEMDDLTVRGTLRIFELLLAKVRVSIGAQVVTNGGGKVETVTALGAGVYRLTWESDDGLAPVSEGDLLESLERARPKGTAPGGFTKHISRLTVVAMDAGATYSDVRVDQGTSAPQVGWEYAQMGSVTNPSRRGLVYTTAMEEGPNVQVRDGVDSWEARDSGASLRVVVGRLNVVGVFAGGPDRYGLAAGDFGGAWVLLDGGGMEFRRGTEGLPVGYFREDKLRLGSGDAYFEVDVENGEADLFLLDPETGALARTRQVLYGDPDGPDSGGLVGSQTEVLNALYGTGGEDGIVTNQARLLLDVFELVDGDGAPTLRGSTAAIQSTLYDPVDGLEVATAGLEVQVYEAEDADGNPTIRGAVAALQASATQAGYVTLGALRSPLAADAPGGPQTVRTSLPVDRLLVPTENGYTVYVADVSGALRSFVVDVDTGAVEGDANLPVQDFVLPPGDPGFDVGAEVLLPPTQATGSVFAAAGQAGLTASFAQQTAEGVEQRTLWFILDAPADRIEWNADVLANADDSVVIYRNGGGSFKGDFEAANGDVRLDGDGVHLAVGGVLNPGSAGLFFGSQGSISAFGQIPGLSFDAFASYFNGFISVERDSSFLDGCRFYNRRPEYEGVGLATLDDVDAYDPNPTFNSVSTGVLILSGYSVNDTITDLSNRLFDAEQAITAIESTLGGGQTVQIAFQKPNGVPGDLYFEGGVMKENY